MVLNVSDTDTFEDIAVLSFSSLIQRIKHYAMYFEKLKIITDSLSPRQMNDLINQFGIRALFTCIDMSFVPKEKNTKAHSMMNNNLFLNQTDYICLQRKINLLYQIIADYKKLIKDKKDTIDDLTFKSELDDENIKDLMKMLSKSSGKGWRNG